VEVPDPGVHGVEGVVDGEADVDGEVDGVVVVGVAGGGTGWSPCPFPPDGRPKYFPVSGS
jgi:hypothetical protein